MERKGGHEVTRGRYWVRRFAVVAAALVGWMAVPAIANAQITIGSTFTTNVFCAPNADYVQGETASSSPSYVVPAGATKITAWSTQGGNTVGAPLAELKVWGNPSDLIG